MSFWYGLPFADIADMPIAAINAYLKRLPARQAEMKLMFADAISIPHRKKSDQKQVIDGWMRTANIHIAHQRRIVSPARLKLMGIGVKYVE